MDQFEDATLGQSLSDLLVAIITSPQYQDLVGYGKPRTGHPEGTVVHHIRELEANLTTMIAIRNRMGVPLSDDQVLRLKILIHTHDTFKGISQKGVAIEHPSSHASLAAEFLRSQGADSSVCQIAQLHDIPYSMWRKRDRSGAERLLTHLRSIEDQPTFIAFQLIDNLTIGKNPAPVAWFVRELSKHSLADSCLWQVFKELLATQTDYFASDARGKLTYFLSREFGSLALPVAGQDEIKILQQFAYQLRRVCEISEAGRSSINGLSENHRFNLPQTWEYDLIGILRDVAKKLPHSQSGMGRLMRSDEEPGSHKRISLLQRSLTNPEDAGTILLRLLDSVSDVLTEQEERVLDKFLIAISAAMQEMSGGKESKSAILVALGAALIRYSEA